MYAMIYVANSKEVYFIDVSDMSSPIKLLLNAEKLTENNFEIWFDNLKKKKKILKEEGINHLLSFPKEFLLSNKKCTQWFD